MKEAGNQAANELAMAYARTFKTPAGKIVLENLEFMYSRRKLTAHKSPEMIIAAAAAHDVVIFLQGMVDAGVRAEIMLKEKSTRGAN